MRDNVLIILVQIGLLGRVEQLVSGEIQQTIERHNRNKTAAATSLGFKTGQEMKRYQKQTEKKQTNILRHNHDARHIDVPQGV